MTGGQQLSYGGRAGTDFRLVRFPPSSPVLAAGCRAPRTAVFGCIQVVPDHRDRSQRREALLQTEIWGLILMGKILIGEDVSRILKLLLHKIHYFYGYFGMAEWPWIHKRNVYLQFCVCVCLWLCVWARMYFTIIGVLLKLIFLTQHENSATGSAVLGFRIRGGRVTRVIFFGSHVLGKNIFFTHTHTYHIILTFFMNKYMRIHMYVICIMLYVCNTYWCFDPDLCPGFSPSNKGGGSLHVVGPKNKFKMQYAYRPYSSTSSSSLVVPKFFRGAQNLLVDWIISRKLFINQSHYPNQHPTLYYGLCVGQC